MFVIMLQFLLERAVMIFKNVKADTNSKQCMREKVIMCSQLPKQ